EKSRNSSCNEVQKKRRKIIRPSGRIRFFSADFFTHQPHQNSPLPRGIHFTFYKLHQRWCMTTFLAPLALLAFQKNPHKKIPARTGIDFVVAVAVALERLRRL